MCYLIVFFLVLLQQYSDLLLNSSVAELSAVWPPIDNVDN